MSYKIAFLPQARKDFDEWKKTDERTTIRIKNILRDISADADAVADSILRYLETGETQEPIALPTRYIAAD